ncbi:MAG: multicopper oxidase family protein [Elusimicrobiota bacterium]
MALCLSGIVRGQPLPYTPVITPNGSSLPWKMENGVKVFHLIAAPCKHEIAPGMIINAWCYNGQTPGPTIEAVEGDRVRILVTNHLPEQTSVHWHGVILPNGMDGVGGLTQPHIQPGETYAYEFTLKQHGTQMYHPHSDEMNQMAMGLMGFFIIHPRTETPKIDRDYAIMLMEWAVPPGAATPDPNVMTDFNLFTFNSRAYPGTAPLLAQKGDRVRVRFGNLSMDSHPIHLHGYSFKIVATDGGDIPPSAQWPATTVNVPVGETRDIEFIADADGDWIFHCHKAHHTMNAMSHTVPVMLGVSQKGVEDKIRGILPYYMAMGENGMGDMAEMAAMMPGPRNTLPMMTGEGPFGPIEMGGMFTILKVRDHLKKGRDPGWYQAPPGTRAWKVNSRRKASR